MTSTEDDIQGLLILPHVRIQNANAISSPLTHGFPSMTAFLGAMWALERKMAAQGIPLVPEKIGVICHWHQEQVHDGFVKTFRLTRNPVTKDGSTAAIVEEGRIHLDVTLVIQVNGGNKYDTGNVIFNASPEERRQLAWQIRELLGTMRIAGGSVLPAAVRPGIRISPQLTPWPDTAQAQDFEFRKLRRHWLPGFTLVSREDLLQQRLQALREDHAKATVLDAWLDLSRINHQSQTLPDGKVLWRHDRPAGAGWLVPIPVGYAALSPLCEAATVKNARDTTTPLRFVEGVYSMGQWISPHRLQRVADLLWYTETDQEQGLYRCRNDYLPAADDSAVDTLTDDQAERLA